MAKARYKYSVTGEVKNLVGPFVLPSDGKQYLVFGFPFALPDRTGNAVFYIRLSDAGAAEMCAKVASSLASGRPLVVHFSSAKEWDTKTDPSYVIDGVDRRRGR